MNQDRAEALAAIAAQVKVCTKCDLYRGTTNAVPGAGDIYTEIMFIGEGPGFNEDKQGLPFVGRSGDYLNYLLNLINLNRDQVFITNVVKHRPPENRDPLPDEIIACKSYLDDQVELINPSVIVTLGRFSMARYFPAAKITQIHGQPKYDDEKGRAYYPLYHPAAVLRNPGLRRDMEMDIKRIPEIIEKVKTMRVGGEPPEPKKDDKDDKSDGGPPKQLSLF